MTDYADLEKRLRERGTAKLDGLANLSVRITGKPQATEPAVASLFLANAADAELDIGAADALATVVK